MYGNIFYKCESWWDDQGTMEELDCVHNCCRWQDSVVKNISGLFLMSNYCALTSIVSFKSV